MSEVSCAHKIITNLPRNVNDNETPGGNAHFTAAEDSSDHNKDVHVLDIVNALGYLEFQDTEVSSGALGNMDDSSDLDKDSSDQALNVPDEVMISKEMDESALDKVDISALDLESHLDVPGDTNNDSDTDIDEDTFPA